MPTTAKGFRTPAGTDPLSQGDDAIRNLAADVDAFAGWMPAGGASGAVLAKTGAGDYAAAWTAPHYLPPGGAPAQVLAKSTGADYDAAWVTPAAGGGGGTQGAQLDRKSMTASSAAISATNEAGATVFLTGNAVSYDGAEVKVEFFAPQLQPSGGVAVTIVLLRDSTVIGQMIYDLQANKVWLPFYVAMFDTPAAGSHTYKVAAFVASGTLVVAADVGGSGKRSPGFLRVTRA